MRSDVENPPVNFLGKMLGPEEIRDPVEGVVIDEDRAKQRLFRLDPGDLRRPSRRRLAAPLLMRPQPARCPRSHRSSRSCAGRNDVRLS